jgi:hypothetical protein
MQEFVYYRSKREVILFASFYLSVFALVPLLTFVYLGSGANDLQIAAYGALVALGIPFTILLRSLSPKVTIGEETIAVNSGFEKVEADLGTVEKIAIGVRTPAVFLHTADRWIPIVINTLTNSWKHMTRTLAERVDDDVKIIDPGNVVRTPRTMDQAHVRDEGPELFTPNETMLIGCFGASPIILALITFILGGPAKPLTGVAGVGLGFALIGQGSRARRKADEDADDEGHWSKSHLVRVGGWFGFAFLSWLGGCSVLL